MGNKLKQFMTLNDGGDLINPDAVKSASSSAPMKVIKPTGSVMVPPVVNTKVESKFIATNDTNSSTKKGLYVGMTRRTVVLNEKHIANMKALSYHANLAFYEVLNEILNEYFENKTVKPLPNVPNMSTKDKLRDALKVIK